MLNNESREKTITEKRGTTVDNPEFNIVWQGQPARLMGRILSALHLNFTWYKISKDELIITRGFFNRKTDTIELYLLFILSINSLHFISYVRDYLINH